MKIKEYGNVLHVKAKDIFKNNKIKNHDYNNKICIFIL